MKTIAYDIVAGILILVLGAMLGWHFKGQAIDAAAMKGAKAETQAVIAGVNKEAAAQHADAMVEQGKSVALGIDQVDIRKTTDSMQAEINRAQFNFPAPTIVAGKTTIAVACPPDPVGSEEFVRLYDAAAFGADPATSASTSTR